MDGVPFILTFAAALGSALNAGLFFIFSVCIMAALARLAPAEGIRAMQSINRVIINALFMAVFMGSALLSAVLVTVAVLQWETPGVGWALAGGIVYLVTSIGVTMIVNVPLNNQIERTDADSAEGQALWARYLDVWTKWNHVRSVGTLVSTGLFIAALI